MQVSAKYAVDSGFIRDRNNQKLPAANFDGKSSIDLKMRDILYKDEKENIRDLPRVILKPQDSAYIISEEIIHVPEGYIAYVFLKNRLSQKGFLALNTGIIDSNYSGPISTLLINFSKNDQYLPVSKNDSDKAFFRVVFHEIGDSAPKSCKYKKNPETYVPNIEYEKYFNYRKEEIANIPKTFLEPTMLKEQISKELTEKLSSISLAKIGMLITIVGLLLSIIPISRDYYFAEKYDLSAINADKLHTEEKINGLENEISTLKIKIASLEDILTKNNRNDGR